MDWLDEASSLAYIVLVIEHDTTECITGRPKETSPPFTYVFPSGLSTRFSSPELYVAPPTKYSLTSLGLSARFDVVLVVPVGKSPAVGS